MFSWNWVKRRQVEFSPEFRADWWLGKAPVRKEHSDRGWGLGVSSWEHGSGFWLGGLTAPQHATRRTGRHAGHAEVSALILLRDSQVCCRAVAPLLPGQVHCLWHLRWQDRAGGSFRGDSLPCFVSKTQRPACREAYQVGVQWPQFAGTGLLLSSWFAQISPPE